MSADSQGARPAERSARTSKTETSDGPHVLSVGDLTRRIHETLQGLGRVSVEGEISRITRAASGHVYFDLKDMDARISCIIWRSQIDRAARFDLEEGMQVVAHGGIDVYPPRGSYSLVVSRLEQAGLGALLVRLEELKAELKAKGWFDRARPLPSMPRVVGVVTSRDGAAFQDFLRTRSGRWPGYPVRLAHTAVQGEGAALSIAGAIRRLDASGVDVIVVCRGGGSLEDLWAFNERPVAEAIFEAGVPVVSGVGHETDHTLCDLVADWRAHTPTDAAQATVPDRATREAALARVGDHLARAIDGELGRRELALAALARSRVLRRPDWTLGDRFVRIREAFHRLRAAGRSRLEACRARVGESSESLARCAPALRIERSGARLRESAMRLPLAIHARIDERVSRLALLERGIEAISPQRVLERGYSITTRPGSPKPILDAAGLAPGEELETRLARGRVSSRVSGVSSEPDSPPADN